VPSLISEFSINIFKSLPALFDPIDEVETYLKKDTICDFILLDLTRKMIDRHNISCSSYKSSNQAKSMLEYPLDENALMKKQFIGTINCQLKVSCIITKLDYNGPGMIGYALNIKLLTPTEHSSYNTELIPLQMCEFQIDPQNGAYFTTIKRKD
jgi:hypothetical protein